MKVTIDEGEEYPVYSIDSEIEDDTWGLQVEVPRILYYRYLFARTLYDAIQKELETIYHKANQ